MHLSEALAAIIAIASGNVWADVTSLTVCAPSIAEMTGTARLALVASIEMAVSALSTAKSMRIADEHTIVKTCEDEVGPAMSEFVSVTESHDHTHVHSHSHGHNHGHGHHHHVDPNASDLKLGLTVALNVILTGVQVAVGIFSSSVALLADALHNATDALALMIAWGARKVSRKPPDSRFTFGYQRIELVAALINLTSLLVLSVFLIKESVERLLQPAPVMALWVIGAAAVALVIDLGTVVLLWTSSKESLNIRAAMLHNLSDAATSVVVLVGAIIIHFFELHWIDPALGILIAVYIFYMALTMIRQVAATLMNNVPPGVDPDRIRAALLQEPEVAKVHHLHIWQLDETKNAASAHIVLNEDLPVSATEEISGRLKHTLGLSSIEHVTLHFEAPGSVCSDENCH